MVTKYRGQKDQMCAIHIMKKNQEKLFFDKEDNKLIKNIDDSIMEEINKLANN